MDTQYKSSFFMTYLQYILSPIIIGIFLYEVFCFLTIGNFVGEIHSYEMPIILWASIGIIINITRIKYIKVTENNILIKTINREKVLDYKYIEWISQSIIGGWYIISIKYENPETGKSKVIYILPEVYNNREGGFLILNPFRELNITKFIREQIIKVNPVYRKENEPSRWYLFIQVLLSIIPFILISIFLF